MQLTREYKKQNQKCKSLSHAMLEKQINGESPEMEDIDKLSEVLSNPALSPTSSGAKGADAGKNTGYMSPQYKLKTYMDEKLK